MKNTFSIESQEILVRIEWDLFHCDVEVKIFHMNWSYFFRVFDEISSTMHGFEVVQAMFIKFNSSSNHESHRDSKPNSYLTHLHTQAFRKISQLVIFKLSSCDSSPPLELVNGESSNVHKMSYTHPNLIPSVDMGSRRREEEMRKDPFLYFWVDLLWPFNFQHEIFKFKYLALYSFNWKKWR